MKQNDLQERAQNKALARLLAIDTEIESWNRKLDLVPFGLSKEQVQQAIDGLLQEAEIWKFILNRTQ